LAAFSFRKRARLRIGRIYMEITRLYPKNDKLE